MPRRHESHSRKLCALIWEDPKDPINKKNYPKGQHGPSQMVKRRSPFGKKLVEKQRLRIHYAMEEKQMFILMKKAKQMQGSIIDSMANLLETRLPTIVYRSGFAKTIFLARQMVSHGHVLVNGKRVNICNYYVKLGDIVEIHSGYQTNSLLIEATTQTGRKAPDYIEVDKDKFQAKVIRHISFTEIPFPKEIKVNLVVGFYSRRL